MNKFDITAWGCITSPDTSKNVKTWEKKTKFEFKKKLQKKTFDTFCWAERFVFKLGEFLSKSDFLIFCQIFGT